jgi:2-polyprenyl-6-methoxyphenol hydroxylase-like FAD-dependent oxidoreductase
MEDKPLKVIIVGGGIGGLLLAILLDRAGIDYLVLEKTLKYKPLGSMLILGTQILLLFDQLGFLEEFDRFSKDCMYSNYLHEDFKPMGSFDFSHYDQRYEYLILSCFY